MNDTIGFIGLGALGYPIANNLIASGHSLCVYNRTAAKADPLVAQGARRASTPADAVTTGGVVFTILWDDQSLVDVVESDGFLQRLRGGTHVSMTTVTPETARRVAALHETNGSTYVEAPIFGVPAAAVGKQLLVCLAGLKGAKERVRPLLADMGALKVFDFGEAVGAGTATKLAGNFLIISALGAMQEAFSVVEKSGVDPKGVFEMLASTLFAIPTYQRFMKTLVDHTPLPKNGIPLKDVGLWKRLAETSATPTPLANRLQEVLERRD